MPRFKRYFYVVYRCFLTLMYISNWCFDKSSPYKLNKLVMINPKYILIYVVFLKQCNKTDYYINDKQNVGNYEAYRSFEINYVSLV